jgi:hypothetical protein
MSAKRRNWPECAKDRSFADGWRTAQIGLPSAQSLSANKRAALTGFVLCNELVLVADEFAPIQATPSGGKEHDLRSR